MDFFIDLLYEVWDFIKKIWVKIVNFAQNIVGFFKNPARLRQLQQDSDLIAVSIKDNLDNGDYKVVNCLFDQSSNEIVDMQENAQGIEAEEIDDATMRAFGNKAMVVLQ